METAIFLHIMKTAGTTLNNIIARQYKPGEVATISYPDPGDERIAQFRDLQPEMKLRYKLVRGHIGFGVHEFLPQPSSYFTILRNPTSRTISQYYQVKNSLDSLKQEGRCSDDRYQQLASSSLEDYLDLAYDEKWDNYHIRVIVGTEGYIYRGDVTRETLELAKENLCKYFSVVGTLDKFDETLFLLKERYGWKNIFYTKRKVGQNSRQEYTNSILDKLKEVNALDLELYDFAKARFEDTMNASKLLSKDVLASYQSKNSSWIGQGSSLWSGGISKAHRSLYDLINGRSPFC
jgi:hypothetical protein